eukprot:1313642-Pyramimonas_sp.AAC.1
MAYIDKTYKSFLETCSVAKPKRFFKNGYGDLDHVMKFRERMLSDIAGGTKPHPIDVVWENKEVSYNLPPDKRFCVAECECPESSWANKDDARSCSRAHGLLRVVMGCSLTAGAWTLHLLLYLRMLLSERRAGP